MPKKLVSRSKKESNNNHDLTAKEIAIMYGKEISLNFSKSKQRQKKLMTEEKIIDYEDESNYESVEECI